MKYYHLTFDLIPFLKRSDIVIPEWTFFTFCDIYGHIYVVEKNEWKLREWLIGNNFNDLVISEHRPYNHSFLPKSRIINNNNLCAIKKLILE